ncbi:DUF2975 domain-containing protein [Ancrocorticia populi]|uniref:DUF2975 domain-containing protein n=1 Tax=Ancrocorticia populi TaxID=2175228 RepID=UPI003F8DD494
MKRSVVYTLKAFIAFFGAIVLAMATWGLPAIANENTEWYPEFAHLKLPLILFGEVALIAALGFLICIGALLSRVREDKIFDESSIQWVRAMTFTPAFGAVACGGAVFFTPGPPALNIAEILAALACLALTLLLVVMRGLLEQASSLRSELDVVI